MYKFNGIFGEAIALCVTVLVLLGLGVHDRWLQLLGLTMGFRLVARNAAAHRFLIPVPPAHEDRNDAVDGPLLRAWIRPGGVAPVAFAGTLSTMAVAGIAALMYHLNGDARFMGFAGLACAMAGVGLLPFKPFCGGDIAHAAIDSWFPLAAPFYIGMCIMPVFNLSVGISPFFLFVPAMLVPEFFHCVFLVGARHAVVRKLAREYGTKADPLEILKAREEREKSHAGSASEGQEEPDAEGDRTWDELDKKLREQFGPKTDLKKYLRDTAALPPPIPKLHAFGWLLLQGAACYGIWRCYLLADKVMSLKEFVGVTLHG